MKKGFASLKFSFGLEPVVQFAAGTTASRPVNRLGALSDLFRGRLEFWCVNSWRSLNLPDRFLFSCFHVVDSFIGGVLVGKGLIFQ